MIIEQVDLINFKKYAQEKIFLGKRVIGIFGQNGAGKSTIFDAICWCLYGVTPTIGKEGQSVKQNELILDGQEDMGVEVSFRYDGQFYKVHRFVRKDGITAAVRLENELVARTSKEVTAYITKILGLDAKAFISASFIRQNEIDLLTSQRAAKRREMINRLFNLQLYDQFQFDAKGKRRETESEILIKDEKIKGLKREMEYFSEILCDEKAIMRDLSRHQSRIEALNRDFDKLEQERSRLQVALDEMLEHEGAVRELVARKSEMRASIERERASLGEAESARSQLPSLELKISQFKEIMNEIESLQPKRDRANEIIVKIREAEERKVALEAEAAGKRSALQGKLASYSKRRDELSSQLAGLSQVLDSRKAGLKDPGILEMELEKANEDLEKINDRLSSESQELVRLSSSFEKLSKERETLSTLSGESRCPTCKQPLGEEVKKALTEKNDADVERISVMILRQRNRLERISDLKAETQDRQRKAITGLREAKELEKDISSIMINMSDLESNLRAVKSAIAEAEGEASLLNAHYSDSMSFTEKRVSDMRAELDGLGFSNERYGSLKKEAEGYEQAILAKERFESLASKKESHLEEIGRLETDIANMDKEVERHRAHVSNIPRTRSRMAKVDEASKKLKDEISAIRVEMGKLSEKISSNEVLKARRAEVGGRMEGEEKALEELRENERRYNILAEAFGNIPVNIHERLKPIIQMEVSQLLDAITQGKYPAVMIDEEYTVQVSYNGIFYPIYRFSGGEKDLINLCLRIGISRVLVSLSKEQGFAHLESLFLDETFSSLDTDRRRNLMAVLNKLENFFSQIVIITHVEDIKEMIPDAIMVEENDDGTARISTII
ncbi:MAG: SMC family ATPase [Candidatus Methanofastidiosa archaeon]|nr:SMC family ATPase [Candidatus Methanofastidiosa archaeon]